MFHTFINAIANYLFVQMCIILFIAPFFFFYIRRYQQKTSESLSINDHCRNFFLSSQANYLVFFWAMGEALIWFVIPEFLLLLMVFMRIHRKRELLIYDVLGTIAGTTVAFFMHLSNHAISSLPYIQPKMIDQTLAWYDARGIWGLLYQPFSGVPYKVFTLTAYHYSFSLFIFLLVAIIVRMSRYAFFFGIFVALYPGLHNFVYKNYLRLFLISTFIFSLLLVRVVHVYGPHYKVHPSNQHNTHIITVYV